MLLLDEAHRVIGERLAGELADVELRFAAELASDLPCVNDLSKHIEQYRGKMLRPMLVLLSGWAVAPARELAEAHRVLATVVEMVHMATLVHDDILDDAEIRRRGATVNSLRGNETAVMLGDYLISHAYHLCSGLGDQAAARLIAKTTNTVCEGELLQLANRDNWALDEGTYFEIIRRKTASLCGASCQLGAMYAGASRETCQAMDRFGERLGMAFQIIDDLLDLTGDPEVVGKSLGKDLEKGKLTLPLIRLLAGSGPGERAGLIELLEGGMGRNGQAGRLGNLLAERGTVEQAREHAEGLIEQAKADLAELPSSPAREMLGAMADAVIQRQF